jgi:hypothetical protein
MGSFDYSSTKHPQRQQQQQLHRQDGRYQCNYTFNWPNHGNTSSSKQKPAAAATCKASALLSSTEDCPTNSSDESGVAKESRKARQYNTQIKSATLTNITDYTFLLKIEDFPRASLY